MLIKWLEPLTRYVYKISNELLSKIFRNNVSYSITRDTYEVTSFGDATRKYLQVSGETDELIIGYFVNAIGEDISVRIKAHFDLSINFEDIGSCTNIEIRERALKKFGYERYVKEGFEKKKIRSIITNNDRKNYDKHCDFLYHFEEDIEKLIFLDNDISFLQVQDASTHKIYFLKIPPGIEDIKEAKAWTFGLNKLQYNPLIEA